MSRARIETSSLFSPIIIRISARFSSKRGPRLIFCPRRKSDCKLRLLKKLIFRQRLLLQFALHPLHHRDRGHEDKRRNHLMWTQGGVKKSPRDADGGERLHHFEITGSRSSR